MSRSLAIADVLWRHFEGCRLTPYQDPCGLWTVGWGHRCPANQKPITQFTADQLRGQDLSRALMICRSAISAPVTDEQEAACISFVGNVGPGDPHHLPEPIEGFLTSHLRVFINLKRYEAATREFVRWDHGLVDGVMVEIPGLKRRRLCEAFLFAGNTIDALRARKFLVVPE